jgi:hypothetical protein
MKFRRDRGQLSPIRRRSANEDVEIDGNHRRALQGGGRIADQHRFHAVALQEWGNAREQ